METLIFKPWKHMSDVVNLFWSSGWDSTFRLLELVLMKNQAVQTYYVIDTARRSFPLEIKAMAEIKTAILHRKPEAAQLILPTQFTLLDDVPTNEQITGQYRRLLKIRHLGGQYEWLSRFADWANLDDLELCVRIREDNFVSTFLGQNVTGESNGGFDYYRLKQDVANPDISLFKYFRFPIYHVSKLEMQNISKAQGFFDIMMRTWFCHSPLKNGLPCGNCLPCDDAIKDGLANRLPLSSLVRWTLLYRPRTKMRRWRRLLLAQGTKP